MAAEIGAVDFGHPSLTANLQPLYAGRHSLPQLVRQHEGRFVLHVELAGEGEHALTLDLVAEASDGEQVGPQRQLMPGEQGARGDREIVAARLAAPSQLALRPPARVADRATAVRTDGFSVCFGPAQAQKHVLHAGVGHAHDLGGAERACAGRKQEMLRHENRSPEEKPASS